MGAVAEALLGLPLWRRRLERLAGCEIDPVAIARLSTLATLHDIGKFNLGFQAKAHADARTTGGHVAEALGAAFGHLPCLADLEEWGERTGDLLGAAICHHGRPIDQRKADAEWQRRWWTPAGDLDPSTGVSDLLARCRAWFPSAFTLGGAALPSSPSFSHAFAGLVMLADWLGSDTGFFPFSKTPDADRMPFARERASQALTGMGLRVPVSDRLDPQGRQPFARITAHPPRPAQEAVLALGRPPQAQGSVTVIEAETGSGKTEAALARFVALFEAGIVDGMYFALPTRSAATQIHGRVLRATRRAFAAPPPVILAVPGYLRVDDVEGNKLAPFEVLWPDHDRFRHRAWAAETPKRYIAGCIVVGTVDQVLLSALMVGHAHLRSTALLRHLLVVDEVHASDTYMTAILEAVLAHHLAAGGHALLLSATLGAETRDRLLDPAGERRPAHLSDALATPYPLITDRSDAVQRVAMKRPTADRDISLAAQPWMDALDALAAAALAAASAGAKTLIIRNTVADCVATQRAVEGAVARSGTPGLLFSCCGTPSPHHSRYARPDREALDRAIENDLGITRSEGGRIVVATQTVQQSLDLDADILFTDLCPADVLLQRLGRLHRHRRQRPSGFQRPAATILVPTKRDLGCLLGDSGMAHNHHGLGSVYADLRVIEATWRLIEERPRWSTPSMNRRLVEHSVHSAALDEVVRDLGPRWHAHAAQMAGSHYAQKRLADLNLIDRTRFYGETSFPTEQRIPTRLGENDRRVGLAPPIESPFGNRVHELTLRAAWVARVSPEVDQAEHLATTARVTHFTFGGKEFVYDRLGLRPDIPQATEVSDDDGP